MPKFTLVAVRRPSAPLKAASLAVLAPPESEAPAAAAAYLALDSSKQSSFRTCFDFMDDLQMQEEQAQGSEVSATGSLDCGPTTVSPRPQPDCCI